MNKVAIFIPTYHRPHAMERVALNIQENTDPDRIQIYFIIEADDRESRATAEHIRGTRYLTNAEKPCYAGAINTAYLWTGEPYFFCGADDLGFHKGWLDVALSHMKGGIQVVGTNDLGSIPIGPERDATHYLVDRKYIQQQSGVIDKPDTVLYPYDHNWTDKEFIETAKKRGVYYYCGNSIVEHLHPVWNKGKWDTTYEKGRATSDKDQQIFIQRQHLWQK